MVSPCHCSKNGTLARLVRDVFPRLFMTMRGIFQRGQRGGWDEGQICRGPLGSEPEALGVEKSPTCFAPDLHDSFALFLHQQHPRSSGLATTTTNTLDYSPQNRCLISVHNGKKVFRTKYVFTSSIICPLKSRITLILPVERPLPAPCLASPSILLSPWALPS